MKKFISLTATLAALMVALLASNSAQAVTSYPLSCRGGGSMVIANDNDDGIKVYFEAGRGAAWEGLEPGQCTWSDRAFRPGEPTVFCDDSGRAVRYISRLIQSDGHTILQVYNDRAGCMQVTSVGP